MVLLILADLYDAVYAVVLLIFISKTLSRSKCILPIKVKLNVIIIYRKVENAMLFRKVLNICYGLDGISWTLFFVMETLIPSPCMIPNLVANPTAVK